MPIWLIGLLIYLSSIFLSFLIFLKCMWYDAKYMQKENSSLDKYDINIFFFVFVPIINMVASIVSLIHEYKYYKMAYPDNNDLFIKIEQKIRRGLNYLSGVQKIIDDDKVAKL